ncbi:MAG: hypothetical protein K0S11_797 [Gammaproteobacteria bacterium]|nr:hypothetical protein [Gammaproteobacteria bacterium]
MSFSLVYFFLIIYLAFTLRILFEQLYFGYVLYQRRALILAPYLCACAINLFRWPYLAARYPKLFAAEFLLGMRLNVAKTHKIHHPKKPSKTEDNNYE